VTFFGVKCLMMIAGMCINSASSMQVEDSGLMGYATVRVLEADVTVWIHTDQILMPKWSKMDVACLEDACVRYSKFCEAADGAQRCEYFFAQPDAGRLARVDVRAADERKIQAAVAEVGTLASNGRGLVVVPLSAFTATAKSSGVPGCRRNETAGCY
jgi:hypothetical protein